MLSHRVVEISRITYNWCYKHEVFSSDELKTMLGYCADLHTTTGTVGEGQVVQEIRKSEVGWIERNEQSAWFFDRISGEIDMLNKQFYNYELWGYDNLQYSRYSSEQESRYDYHLDMMLGQCTEGLGEARKLSATLLLNDDFQGGDFQFNVSNESEPVCPELKPGSLIVFPSFLLHRVTKVTKGVRHSLVAWAVGPKFR